MYSLLDFSALCIICWLLGQSKYIPHGSVVLHSLFIFKNVAWHHMLSILESLFIDKLWNSHWTGMYFVLIGFRSIGWY